MIEELITQNRSVRRFYESEAVPRETLKWLVNLGRLSASAANLQPLKYLLVDDPVRRGAVFPCLAWAGYLKDWPGPPEGERPTAYILILGDREIAANFGCDHGIAAQSILLGARQKGLGGCMIGSVNREQLREVLNLPTRFDILLVIALGKPKEEVILEEVGPDGNVKYWRDESGVHYVPKRRLEDIILE